MEEKIFAKEGSLYVSPEKRLQNDMEIEGAIPTLSNRGRITKLTFFGGDDSDTPVTGIYDGDYPGGNYRYVGLFGDGGILEVVSGPTSNKAATIAASPDYAKIMIDDGTAPYGIEVSPQGFKLTGLNSYATNAAAVAAIGVGRLYKSTVLIGDSPQILMTV